MAEMRSLSEYLDGFKTSYDATGALQSVASAKSQLTADITTISNQVNEAISSFKSAGKDSQIQDLTKALELAKSGLDITNSHVEGDIGGVLSSTNGLRTGTIQEILDKINRGKSLNTNILEDIWNNTGGLLFGKTGAQAEAERLNSDIDRLNKKGEAQLIAIENSINGVKFGVIGNMVDNGALGQSIEFDGSYSFNAEEWEKANPEHHLNFIQQVGCFVTGAVESIVKAVEGLADAVLTPVAGVVSLFKGNDDHFLKKAIEYDVAGNVVGGTLGTIFAGSKEAYDDSTGKKIGNFYGSTVTHGALWLTGLGALSAISIAGNTAESAIQDGGTVGAGLLKGVAFGGLSYFGGKVLPKVTSSISNKLSAYASSHTNILAKGINGVSNITSRLVKAGGTSFKNWRTLGTKGKIVSAVSMPARVAVKAVTGPMNTGAKVLSKFAGTKVGTALVNLDKKVDTLIQTGRTYMTKTGRQQIKDYEAAREAWENAGRNMNSPEYDKMVKASEKIPQAQRPVVGEKAFTSTEIDNYKLNYNRARNDWIRAGRPTSGAEYDAYTNAYQNIPATQRPANLGDYAYTTRAANFYADDYNDATNNWIRSGRPNTGPEYTAMQTAHNNLPPDLQSSTTLGKFAAGQGYSDFSINNYNNKLTDWRLAGSPTSGAEYDAMKTAFDNIPEGALKPATMGEVGMNSQTIRTLQRKYNNELTTWIANGSQQYGTEYQNVLNAWNALPNSVRPTNAGDLFGTGIALSTPGQQMAGGIMSGIYSSGI